MNENLRCEGGNCWDNGMWNMPLGRTETSVTEKGYKYPFSFYIEQVTDFITTLLPRTSVHKLEVYRKK